MHLHHSRVMGRYRRSYWVYEGKKREMLSLNTQI